MNVLEAYIGKKYDLELDKNLTTTPKTQSIKKN